MVLGCYHSLLFRWVGCKSEKSESGILKMDVMCINAMNYLGRFMKVFCITGTSKASLLPLVAKEKTH